VRWFQYGFAALLKAGTLALSLYLLEKKEIGITELVLAVTLSFLIINEVSALSRRFFDLFEASASVSNGLATLIRRHDIKNTGAAAVATVSAGNITLQDISFAYPDATPVFSHLNLSIAAGEKVGLVGYSGAGKSTLLNLILRQYEPQAGRILIDGIDIRDMTQASLRSRIGYIPQDPSLFHRSLRENIGYGDLGASDAQIEAAARKAGAHEFISALPEGYDAMVGERGVKLSGGQRQRVILARVLLKNAPIVILDEATASLDAITEKMILDSLENELADKTVIVIAHRLSTVAQLDRILVLDQGRIKEDESYSDFLYKNDSIGSFGNNPD
jgi:ATP-binding cassette subfamily B protein